MNTLAILFANYDKLGRECNKYYTKNGGIYTNDTIGIKERWMNERMNLVQFIINNAIPEERRASFSTFEKDTYIQEQVLKIGRTVLKLGRIARKAKMNEAQLEQLHSEVSANIL